MTVPGLRAILGNTRLGMKDLAVVGVGAFGACAVSEIYKLVAASKESQNTKLVKNEANILN